MSSLPSPTATVATPPPALPVAVAITPDGKRALVAKSGANRVGLLDIDGQKVSNAQVDGKNYDMATGLHPLNVQIAPDGKLAIVNNIGGGQDGQIDTVGIIDLKRARHAPSIRSSSATVPKGWRSARREVMPPR